MTVTAITDGAPTVRPLLRRYRETREGSAFRVAWPYGRAVPPPNDVRLFQRTEPIAQPSRPTVPCSPRIARAWSSPGIRRQIFGTFPLCPWPSSHNRRVPDQAQPRTVLEVPFPFRITSPDLARGIFGVSSREGTAPRRPWLRYSCGHDQRISLPRSKYCCCRH